MNGNVLVTGAAGFIGAAVCLKLLEEGFNVTGIDNLNNYYSPKLKNARLQRIKEHKNARNFQFEKVDIADIGPLQTVIGKAKPQYIVHLAAQASVRYDNPGAYLHSNLTGHLNMVESCRKLNELSPGCLKHFVYASTSSVYGGDEGSEVPFKENAFKNQPKSLYAATKCANEAMSHAYSHLYDIAATGLRFFTVYGPWGRPDMSPIMFASSIMENKPINVFNHGDLYRDFTYVDDIAEGVVRIMQKPKALGSKHDVFNIGNSSPVKLTDYIAALEDALGKKAQLNLKPLPPAEQYINYADTTRLHEAVGYKPSTDLKDGLKAFAEWFMPWHEKQDEAAA